MRKILVLALMAISTVVLARGTVINPVAYLEVIPPAGYYNCTAALPGFPLARGIVLADGICRLGYIDQPGTWHLVAYALPSTGLPPVDGDVTLPASTFTVVVTLE